MLANLPEIQAEFALCNKTPNHPACGKVFQNFFPIQSIQKAGQDKIVDSIKFRNSTPG